MSFWIYLLIVEIIPIIIWILGAICEEKSSKFPNTKVGYKSKFAIKNKTTWEYANKLVAKMNGSIGTFLFIINAVILFSIGIEAFVFILTLNLIISVALFYMIDRLLRRKFDKEGNIKNN